MAYEVYGGPLAPGFAGLYCLRDSVTLHCLRDAQGNLLTFPDAKAAEAAIPVTVKHTHEAEVVAAPPVKTEYHGKAK